MFYKKSSHHYRVGGDVAVIAFPTGVELMFIAAVSANLVDCSTGPNSDSDS
jgi:hypothetical protein